jgi:hypothetical protein
MKMCGSNETSRSDLSYSWAIAVDEADSPDITSYSIETNKYKLRPYALTVGLTYTVTLTVVYGSSGTSWSQSSVDVTVVSSNIVAVISDGSSLTVPFGASRVVDASSSYDEDQTGVSGLDAGLQFAWSCVQTSPVYSVSCNVDLSVESTYYYSPSM